MTKENNTNPFYDKKVQKILDKLISEEMIAYYFYTGCIVASCCDVKKQLKTIFTDIAADELSDHYNKLVEFAISNGYDIPFKPKDYEKNAASSLSKQLDKLKTKQEISYYVNEAFKQEETAINSYEEAMSYKDIPYELNAILMQNFYDEKEHLSKLETLKNALEAGAQLAWC